MKKEEVKVEVEEENEQLVIKEERPPSPPVIKDELDEFFYGVFHTKAEEQKILEADEQLQPDFEEKQEEQEPVLFLGRPYLKNRQGRSRENRLRKENERRLQSLVEGVRGDSVCTNSACKATPVFLVDDYSTGDSICSECGAVQSHFGLGQVTIPHMYSYGGNGRLGSGYKREVHFQVRIRQLTIRDPVLDPKLLTAIRKFLWPEPFSNERLKGLEAEYGPTDVWGPKTFRALFKREELAKQIKENPDWGGNRISQHWIQLRCRLEFEPNHVDISEDVERRMRARYRCVDRAFMAICADPSSSSKEGGNGKRKEEPRRNIYNLNYIGAQLLRMEDPDAFHEYAKFLPQATNQRQPEVNNFYWAKIIDWCQKHARFINDKDQCCRIEWEYTPITETELFGLFSFFR